MSLAFSRVSDSPQPSSSDDFKLPVMSREEVRARLWAIRRSGFPFWGIERRSRVERFVLKNFMRNVPQRCDLGPKRMKRVIRAILDIETGRFRYEGSNKGFRWARYWEAEPNKAPTVVHTLNFSGGKPTVRLGTAPNNEKMPSFAKLFGGKPVIRLPSLLKERK